MFFTKFLRKFRENGLIFYWYGKNLVKHQFIMSPHSILIIENHQLIANSYAYCLNKVCMSNNDQTPKIEIASNCDEALKIINDSKNSSPIDLVISGICIPFSKKKGHLCAEDLGIKLKKIQPSLKIMIITRIDCNYRIRSIIKKMNPDALLLKKDINEFELINAINAVMTDAPFYSKSILQIMRKEISNDFLLDEIDRQLIFELSIGTKMKMMPDILPMTLRGIDKRKKQLKDLFNTNPDDDRELILKALENGLI